MYLYDESDDELGLRSNIINCIDIQGQSTTWIGTGQGISVMHDSVTIYSLDTMQIINDKTRLIFDSIAAMSVQDHHFSFSSLTSIDGDPAGTGIYITENGLSDELKWYRFDQPIDTIDDSLAAFGLGYFKARPLVGTRGVVSYSMDLNNNNLWITSWYGGLRRLDILQKTDWIRIPLPLDNQETLITCDNDQYIEENNNLILKDYYWDSSDPHGNNNHKTFSVLSYGDTIWVGTANGINRGIISISGCIDWMHYFHPNDNLSGNWVLDIEKQEYDNKRIIWAVTVSTNILSTEETSVSYTPDDGETWYIVEDLKGIRCHDIASQDSTILIASDVGLWKSINGENWELIPPAVEATPVSSNQILNNKVYSVVGDSRDYFVDPIIWIGTPDGLARTYNKTTDNWQIYRAVNNRSEIYAYPNPFSPFTHNQLNNDGWVRFNTGDTQISTVILNIYSFAMGKVYSEKFNWQSNSGAVKWNGRDQNGELVANGVYFVHLELFDTISNIDEEHWIKLVVVK
jgi:hypothetical protein